MYSKAMFADSFQKECHELRRSLSSVPGLSDEIATSKIRSLELRLQEAQNTLAAYDLKHCLENLKALRELLPLSQSSSKQKFSFKNRGGLVSGKTTGEAPPSLTRIRDDREEPKAPANAEGLSEETIYLPASVAESEPRTNYVARNLSRCVLHIETPLLALQLDGLRSCIIRCSNVDGSVMINNCVDCKFILVCRQIRIHDTRDSSFYLYCVGHPIIERCTELRFAPNPPETDDAKIMRHPNRYAQVADFDCPGLESSNWRHLTEEETSLASEELNDLFLHARDGPKRVGL